MDLKIIFGRNLLLKKYIKIRDVAIHFNRKRGISLNLGGFKNKEVVVDLSSRTIDYRTINEADAKKYIGGRGLGVKYVLDNGPKWNRSHPRTFFAS